MLTPFADRDWTQARGEDPHYYTSDRWHYYDAAVELVQSVAAGAETVLEIGPYRLPLFPAADTLDVDRQLAPTYRHDAGAVPWPIADGQYDVAVALQVWEHLGAIPGEPRAGLFGAVQQPAFAELKRVARAAVLSLPWQWQTGDVRHDGIDDDRLAAWFDVAPDCRVVVANRVLLAWQFQPSNRLAVKP